MAPRETTSAPPSADTNSRLRPPEWMFRRVLVVSDVLTVCVAWAITLAVGDDGGGHAMALAGWSIAGTAVTVALLGREQLYRSRIWAVHAVEVQRVGHATIVAAGVLLAVDAALGGPLSWSAILGATLIAWALLVLIRAAFQVWLDDAAPAGPHRSLLLTGDVEEGRHVLEVLRGRPELGYRVVGLASPQRPTSRLAAPWVGTPEDLPVLVQLTAATGVIVIGDTFESPRLRRLLAEVRPLNVHVHLATSGPDRTPQLRALPLSHRGAAPEDAPALSSLQHVVKRGFDLVAGTTLAIVALPVAAVAAALIRISSGGPVLVRDVRLGPRGEPVTVPRLRTRQLPDTRLAHWVGRLCRRLCIDELPQLGSVLAGSMTLVGPRPAPPGQVLAPVDVNAGLIGLRHVEMADYPAHAAYRRTDEFYVENWSIGLDLSIIAASATHLVWRTLRHAVRGEQHRGTATV